MRTFVKVFVCCLVAVAALVYFRNGPTPAAATSTPVPPEVVAAMLCETAIRQQAKFPTEVEFGSGIAGAPAVAPLASDPTVTGVRGRAKLMNGIGNKIPHTYGCDIKDGRVLRASAQPG